MNTKRLGFIAVLIALFAGVALAKSTPYSTPKFSATFNGPVSFQIDENNAKTSVNNEWHSVADGVFQELNIREVASGIDVDQASLDYYTNQSLGSSTAIERKNGVYQGHIWSYVSYNKDGEEWRMWYIIVDANTVFIMTELTEIGKDGSADWATFANSLVIK